MRVERLDPVTASAFYDRAADIVDDDGMPGLCQGGMPHRFDGAECSVCGTEPYAPDDERPAAWYAEPYAEHICFDDCRHRRRQK